MADPGFPGQHTTTTTVKSSSTVVDTTIRYDSSYIRTIPGYLKIAQIVGEIPPIILQFLANVTNFRL